MFSVMFEVKRRPERSEEYLHLAGELKPLLEKVDGFIDNERFESQRRSGWLLSHSTWRDEKSVVRWRTVARHHEVQTRGREAVFEDYHLRVGDVVADSAPPDAALVREMRLDATEVGVAKYATFTEVTPRDGAQTASAATMLAEHLGLNLRVEGLVDFDVFASINTRGKLALLASWRTAAAAKAWTPRSFTGVASLRHRVVRVVRDYGMFDRREAPQYYPEAKQ